MKTTTAVLFALAMASAAGPAIAATRTWNGSASTAWEVAANWTPAGVPASDDAVVVNSGSVVAANPVTVASITLAGGTATFNASATVGVLTLAGGSLAGTGTVSVGGSLDWASGAMAGTGLTVVGPAATLSITSASTRSLSQRTLENRGTAVWTGAGTLYAYAGAVVTNAGNWDLQVDGVFSYDGAHPPTPVFHNGGSLTKSAGNGTFAFNQAAFHNHGSVSVLKGTLNPSASGNSTGAFAVAADATLLFSGNAYSLAAGSSVSGAGRVRANSPLTFSGTAFGPAILELNAAGTFNGPVAVQSATLNAGATFNAAFDAASVILPSTAAFVGPAGIGSLDLTGSATFQGPGTVGSLALSGSLAGTNTVTITTNLDWTAGTMAGTGKTVVGPAASLHIDSASTKSLSQRTLVNQGSALWTSTGTLFAYANALVQNDGTWEVRADATFSYDGAHPPTPTFLNNGSFTKAAGVGSFTFHQAAFNNAGSVHLLSGTLVLDSGGSASGACILDAGTVLSLTGGTHSFAAGSSLSGAGRLSINTTVNYAGNPVSLGRIDLLGGGGSFATPVTLDSPATVAGTWTFAGAFTAPALSISGSATFQDVVDVPSVSVSGGAAFNATASLDSLSVAGGTATFNAPASVGSLDLGPAASGGSVGGTAVLTIATNLAWASGSMTGTGRTVILPAATLSISSASTRSLSQRALENRGAAVWNGAGTLYAYAGAVVTNAGNWDLQVDGVFSYDGAHPPTPVFHNGGSLTKSAGNGTFAFNQAAFHNHGSVSVLKGTLNPSAGGNSTGAFAVAADATLLFSGNAYSLAAGSSVSGAGRVRANSPLTFSGTAFGPAILELNAAGTFNGPVAVQSATLNAGATFNAAFDAASVVLPSTAAFVGPAGIGTLSLTGSATFQGPGTVGSLALSGSLAGTNTVTITTNLDWTAGTMAGTGKTVVGPAASLHIDSASTKSLSQRTLVNQGSATWTGAGTLYAYANALVQNDGSWEVKAASMFSYDGAHPPTPVFRNNGAFTKSVALLAFTFNQAAVHNAGTFDVAGGTLQVQGGRYTQFQGATRIGPGATLSAPTQPVVVQSGTLSGSGTLAGSLDCSGEVNPGASIGTLTVTGSAALRGVVNLESGGTSPGGTSDLLAVGGTPGSVTLGGTLDVILSKGYRPNEGDRIWAMTYKSRSGEFAVINGLDLGGGLRLTPVYGATDLSFLVTRGEPEPLSMVISPWERGQFLVRFTGQPGVRSVIQVSEDLLDWTDLYSETTADGVISYVDVGAPGHPYRFYRALPSP